MKLDDLIIKACEVAEERQGVSIDLNAGLYLNLLESSGILEIYSLGKEILRNYVRVSREALEPYKIFEYDTGNDAIFELHGLNDNLLQNKEMRRINGVLNFYHSKYRVDNSEIVPVGNEEYLKQLDEQIKKVVSYVNKNLYFRRPIDRYIIEGTIDTNSKDKLIEMLRKTKDPDQIILMKYNINQGTIIDNRIKGTKEEYVVNKVIEEINKNR